MAIQIDIYEKGINEISLYVQKFGTLRNDQKSYCCRCRLKVYKNIKEENEKERGISDIIKFKCDVYYLNGITANTIFQSMAKN